MGFSAENPISAADMAAYLQLCPTHNLDLFMYLVGEMDHEYLERKYGKAAEKKTVSVKSPKVSKDDEPGELMTGNNF